MEREAEIVAQSGRLGAVTIATNMAGRGTDIILGGNAEFMARLKLREMLMPRYHLKFIIVVSSYNLFRTCSSIFVLILAQISHSLLTCLSSVAGTIQLYIFNYRNSLANCLSDMSREQV